MTKKKAELVNNGLVNVPNIDIEYKGFHIVPKLDFGKYPHSDVNTYRKGYVVVKNGLNAMPGAIWASSVIESKELIESYLESDGNVELFWAITRRKQGLEEYEEV